MVIDRSNPNVWGRETHAKTIVDQFLNKGIGIDAWIKISLTGIEVLATETRAVICSTDTFLRYAEAMGLISEGE